jgi:hypothetical protein
MAIIFAESARSVADAEYSGSNSTVSPYSKEEFDENQYKKKGSPFRKRGQTHY